MSAVGVGKLELLPQCNTICTRDTFWSQTVREIFWRIISNGVWFQKPFHTRTHRQYYRNLPAPLWEGDRTNEQNRKTTTQIIWFSFLYQVEELEKALEHRQMAPWTRSRQQFRHKFRTKPFGKQKNLLIYEEHRQPIKNFFKTWKMIRYSAKNPEYTIVYFSIQLKYTKYFKSMNNQCRFSSARWGKEVL